MSEDEVRLADAAFREFAEMTAANEGGTFEQAHKATWRLFECGSLKLVDEGDRLRVRGDGWRAGAERNESREAS